MIAKSNFRKITPFLWEIPQTYRQDMRVPARIFASEALLDNSLKDNSLEQLVNIATLPGIQKAAYAMPDVHEGYGFPIGGVAATIYPDGSISPGGIGYDINCGVRLLKTNLKAEALNHHQGLLAKRLFEEIPCGTTHKIKLKLDNKQLDGALEKGAAWIVEQGYGKEEDLHFLESHGCLPNTDPATVSEHAKERGRGQLGTLGSGNHFVEVDRVDEIFDEKIARQFDLFQDQVVVLIHTGSRGLGHEVATNHIKIMVNNLPKFGITVPDMQLACAPFSSGEGTRYFNAMASAANFAWANRQLIAWEVRLVFKEMFEENLTTLFDVAHNIAKIEEHEVSGQIKQVIVHRKGATRAFGPNNKELISEYKSTGQPVIIPGSMGTASYILAGTAESMKEAFGSTCHGSGRRMSRHTALKEIQGKKLKMDLETEGIFIQSGSIKGLAEEAPLAYKDIDEVIDVVDRAQLAKRVAKLKPMVVIKG